MNIAAIEKILMNVISTEMLIKTALLKLFGKEVANLKLFGKEVANLKLFGKDGAIASPIRSRLPTPALIGHSPLIPAAKKCHTMQLLVLLASVGCAGHSSSSLQTGSPLDVPETSDDEQHRPARERASPPLNQADPPCKCSICCNHYEIEEEGRLPCLSACNHKLCLQCKRAMRDSNCPFCRSRFGFAVTRFDRERLKKIEIQRENANRKGRSDLCSCGGNDPYDPANSNIRTIPSIPYNHDPLAADYDVKRRTPGSYAPVKLFPSEMRRLKGSIEQSYSSYKKLNEECGGLERALLNKTSRYLDGKKPSILLGEKTKSILSETKEAILRGDIKMGNAAGKGSVERRERGGGCANTPVAADERRKNPLPALNFNETEELRSNPNFNNFFLATPPNCNFRFDFSQPPVSYPVPGPKILIVSNRPSITIERPASDSSGARGSQNNSTFMETMLGIIIPVIEAPNAILDALLSEVPENKKIMVSKFDLETGAIETVGKLTARVELQNHRGTIKKMAPMEKFNFGIARTGRVAFIVGGKYWVDRENEAGDRAMERDREMERDWNPFIARTDASPAAGTSGFLREVVTFFENGEHLEKNCRLNVPRSRCSALVYKNKLYVVGGYNNAGYLDSVEACYLAAADSNDHHNYHHRDHLANSSCSLKGSWMLLRPINHPRADSVLIEFGGRMFLLGGFNGKEYLEFIEVYDDEKDEWVDYGYMRGGRAGFSATVFEKRIYIAGGWDHGGLSIDGIDTSSGMDTNSGLSTDGTDTNSGLSTDVMDTNSSPIGSTCLLKTVRSFDVENKEWREEPPMNVARAYPTLVTVQRIMSEEKRGKLRRRMLKESPVKFNSEGPVKFNSEGRNSEQGASSGNGKGESVTERNTQRALKEILPGLNQKGEMRDDHILVIGGNRSDGRTVEINEKFNPNSKDPRWKLKEEPYPNFKKVVWEALY